MLRSITLLFCFVTQALAVPLASPPLNCSVAINSFQSTSDGMPTDGIFDVVIYAPEGDGDCGSGHFPTIFFTGGFGGNVPVTFYSDLLTRVASRGFIVVGAHRFEQPKYKMEGQKFLEIIEWAQAGHLAALMSQHKLSAMPDSERVAVMAQSAGNHVIGETLSMKCSIVKAFVMIDPVDGSDPFGIDKSQDLIIPGKMLNFTTPGLLLNNGLDPTKLHSLYPACAPASLSNDRFYNAWVGPVWNINATVYGHVDCLNDGDIKGASFLCPTNPDTDKTKYRAMLADSAVTFLLALFNGRPEQIKAFEDPAHFSIDVVLKHDMKGLEYSQIKPGCINTPATYARNVLV